MGLFDSAKEKLGQNSDKVDQGVDKAGDAVNEKTGDKYSDQVEKGGDALKDQLGDK